MHGNRPNTINRYNKYKENVLQAIVYNSHRPIKPVQTDYYQQHQPQQSTQGQVLSDYGSYQVRGSFSFHFISFLTKFSIFDQLKNVSIKCLTINQLIHQHKDKKLL